MQQPMGQPDQLGNQQQVTQQMVLCPVRVVYETQILIPPGDQIQPNQTIFINPHNPPPWVQNRLQNQVLYVQQMPNIVSPIQQNIDQNQMYLQQNYSYQIPQMLSQERPMQIQNNFQNIGTNIGGNPNERLYMANIGQVQNQIKQQNVQMLNNQIDMQRFLRPQVNQAYRPQMLVNPSQNLQNLPQTNIPSTQVNNNAANVPTNNINIVQNIPIPNANVAMNNPNIGQVQPRLQPAPNIRPVQQPTKVANTVVGNTMNATTVGATVPNRVPIPQATKIGNMVFEHSISNINTVGNNVPRVPQQAYRPIQPRPQYRPNITNVQTVAPVQNIPYYNQKPNQIQNYNVSNNRKRKCESPDVSKKKTIAFESNVQTPNIINIKTSNEIGVNTNPIHKIGDRIQNSVPHLKMVDNVSQTTVNDMSLINSNIEIIKNLTATTSMNVDKIENEKLFRNTVFTQARGRLLNDKEIKINESTNVNNEHLINALNANVARQLPNSAINPSTIKEDTNMIVVMQNDGMINQNDINVAFSARNMPIIENVIDMNDVKTLNDKATSPNDTSAIDIRKIESNDSRQVLNVKVDDNKILNENKSNFMENKPTIIITSSDVINLHNNKHPLDGKEILSNNSNCFNNLKIPDNSFTNEDKHTVEDKLDNNNKAAISDKQINSVNTENVTVTSNNIRNSVNNNRCVEEKEVNDNKGSINTKISCTVKESLDDHRFSLNDINKSNDDNVKLKACKVQLNSNEVQLNAHQISQIQLNNSKLQIKDDKLPLKDDKHQINDTIDSNKVKEEMMDKIIFKQEVYDQDILTHVLDGYVIQESNVAFPIRKPIKEKTIYNQNTTDEKTSKHKNEMKTPIDLPLLPLCYMHFNNEKIKAENDNVDVKDELKKEKIEERAVEVKKDEKGHPFSQLNHSTIKTWTVDQLIKHLYSQDWIETASILQEHEIDGESLFLVSKSQLLHIGISEEHSNVICEYVHS